MKVIRLTLFTHFAYIPTGESTNLYAFAWNLSSWMFALSEDKIFAWKKNHLDQGLRASYPQLGNSTRYHCTINVWWFEQDRAQTVRCQVIQNWWESFMHIFKEKFSTNVTRPGAQFLQFSLLWVSLSEAYFNQHKRDFIPASIITVLKPATQMW